MATYVLVVEPRAATRTPETPKQTLAGRRLAREKLRAAELVILSEPPPPHFEA